MLKASVQINSPSSVNNTSGLLRNGYQCSVKVAVDGKQHCVKKLFNVCLCFRWLKFEEDVEDGGDRWSKPYVATLSLHSLFELRSCILNGTVMLDMRANTLDEIAGCSKIYLSF